MLLDLDHVLYVKQENSVPLDLKPVLNVKQERSMLCLDLQPVQHAKNGLQVKKDQHIVTKVSLTEIFLF